MRTLAQSAAAAVVIAFGPISPVVAQVVVVQADRVLAEPGKAPRGPTTIVVENGRITALLDGRQAGPSGATVIDLGNKFVLPGLIDSHVHLDSDAGGQAALMERVTSSPGLDALRAQWNGMKTLRAGFTTVRNLGDGSGATLALRDAIAAGWVQGPRIIDAGRSISVTSGHMDGTLSVSEDLQSAISQDNLCNSAEQCREAVRRQIRRGVDVIKIATTGGVNSRIGVGIGVQMFSDEAKAAVETAHLHGKKIAVHAHGTEGINLALAAGADSIEHGTVPNDETFKLFRQHGAYYVPTLSTVNGYRERLAKDPNAYPPAGSAAERTRNSAMQQRAGERQVRTGGRRCGIETGSTSEPAADPRRGRIHRGRRWSCPPPPRASRRRPSRCPPPGRSPSDRPRRRADASLAKLDQLIAKKHDLKQAAMQETFHGSDRTAGVFGESGKHGS